MSRWGPASLVVVFVDYDFFAGLADVDELGAGPASVGGGNSDAGTGAGV